MAYEPKIIRKSTVEKIDTVIMPKQPGRIRQKEKKTTINESRTNGGSGNEAGTGALIFYGCPVGGQRGPEKGRLEWVNGLITTNGEIPIECGCDGTCAIG